jgi:hypothetical protein
MRNYRLVKKNSIVIFIFLILVIFTFFPLAGSQKICQNNNLIYDGVTIKNNETAWEVENTHSFSAEAIATDSQNNIIVVGPGGEAVTELPYGYVVKYNPDGEMLWEDYRIFRLFNGLTNQLLNFVYSKSILFYQITKSIIRSSKDYKTVQAIDNDDLNIEKTIKNHYFLNIENDDTVFLINRWIRFYDIAIDSQDNIIVVGEIQHRNTQECRDVYVIKYDPAGKVLWDRIFKRYWIFSRDYSTGVTIDSNDDIFLSIKTQEKETDEYNGWVLKISSKNGFKLNEAFYQDIPTTFYDISRDNNDNIYVAGHLFNSGQMNVFKYSNNLEFLEKWTLPIMLFEPWAIDVDPDNNVVVVGSIGFSDNLKQYIVKFDTFGEVLWSYKSSEYGVLFDVIAYDYNSTIVTGAGVGDKKYKFYVGLFDENGNQYKQYIAGNVTFLQIFISMCLDVDNNQDIVVGGFRNYGYYQFFMYIMKFTY